MSRRRGAQKKGPPLKGEGPELASGPASGEHVPDNGRRCVTVSIYAALSAPSVANQRAGAATARRRKAACRTRPSETSSTRASHETSRMRVFKGSAYAVTSQNGRACRTEPDW